MKDRSKDKRRNVSLTDGEVRLLNDLRMFPDYLGDLASEETLRTALDAALIRVIGRKRSTGRPFVRPTKKGLRHITALLG